MRHRKRRVLEGRWFNLNSVTSPTTGRKHYEISINAWKLSGMTNYTLDDMRLHFDPYSNRGARYGTKWKYSNRETAEQLLTVAILKFGV
jgi:hypothetical protein